MISRLKYLLTFSLIFTHFYTYFSQSIELTEEEITYLQNNPNVTFGIDEEFVPFIVIDDNGELTGFEVEYLDILSKTTGLNIELVPGSWDEMVTKATSWEIDGLAYSSVIEERRKKLDFSTSYLRTDQIIYSNNKSRIENPTGLDDFAGKKIAIQKNDAFNTNIAKNIPNARIIYFETIDEIINALASEHIDYVIGGANINFIANDRGLPNILINYIVTEFPCEIVYSIRNDKPILKSIINKGIKNLSPSIKSNLIKKWLSSGTTQHSIDLTDKERQFIKKHPSINFRGAKEEAPFVFIKDGKPIGFDFELIRKINSISGLDITITPGDWNTVLEDAKIKKNDGLVTNVKTKSREPYFNFTNPYLNIYTGIFSLKNTNEKAMTITDLSNKRVGVLKGFDKAIEIIETNQEITRVEYDSRKELTQALITKEIDFVITISTYEYYLASNGISAIQIDFLVDDYPLELTYAIRKDWPELKSILDKCIATISTKERIQLFNSWVSPALAATNNKTSSFTDQERDFLKRKKSVDIGYLNGFAPITMQNAKGQLTGITQDYLLLLEEKLKIKFNHIYSENKQHLFSKLNENEIDLAITARISGATSHHIETIPLITEPFSLIIPVDEPYKNTLKYVKDFKVGISKTSPFMNDLSKKYPHILFIKVESEEEGLNMVKNKELNGYMALISTSTYDIRSLGFIDLKIGHVTNEKVEFHLTGVSNESTEIIPLFNKGISSISELEVYKMKEKWVNLEIKPLKNYSKTIAIALFLIALVVFFLIWRRRSIE